MQIPGLHLTSLQAATDASGPGAAERRFAKRSIAACSSSCSELTAETPKRFKF